MLIGGTNYSLIPEGPLKRLAAHIQEVGHILAGFAFVD